MAQFPETGLPLRALAQAVLRSPSSLTSGEREIIAATVSAGNACFFCTQSHAAAARALLGDDGTLVDAAMADASDPALSEKLRALLVIALAVRESGQNVKPEHIERARAAGADDRAIHDAVLVAAAFCMFNRYVDGLATFAPPETSAYVEMGKMLAQQGYVDRPSAD